MTERKVEIDGELYDADHVIEVVNDSVQRDLEDPNLSETYKDAVIDTAVEILSKIPPRTDG